MKVYVLTRFSAFDEEVFVDVAPSKKKAEKMHREKHPHMIPDTLSRDGKWIWHDRDTMEFLSVIEKEI